MVGCGTHPFLQSGQQLGLSNQANNRSLSITPATELGRLDADNRELQSQLAQVQQQKRFLNDELKLVKDQLDEMAGQVQQLRTAKQSADSKADGLLASTRHRGGATITANRSNQRVAEATGSLSLPSLPGIAAQRDGRVVRLNLPTDQLFRSGSAQLEASGIQLLDRIAEVMNRDYTRQHISIEGHTDSAPVIGGKSSHQLTAEQSLAIFNQLTARNLIPASQLMTVAHGSNYPQADNATPAGRSINRRIEIVIYPEALSP